MFARHLSMAEFLEELSTSSLESDGFGISPQDSLDDLAVNDNVDSVKMPLNSIESVLKPVNTSIDTVIETAVLQPVKTISIGQKKPKTMTQKRGFFRRLLGKKFKPITIEDSPEVLFAELHKSNDSLEISAPFKYSRHSCESELYNGVFDDYLSTVNDVLKPCEPTQPRVDYVLKPTQPRDEYQTEPFESNSIKEPVRVSSESIDTLVNHQFKANPVKDESDDEDSIVLTGYYSKSRRFSLDIQDHHHHSQLQRQSASW